MLLEIVLFVALGILVGSFTGLAPGIHINLVGATLVTLSAAAFSEVIPIYLVVFIVAMSITHIFVDFIPSIFLGCPNSDTELSVLPGHVLLKKGRGYQAIKIAALGCLVGIFILTLTAFPMNLFISKIYPVIKSLIPYILILVCIVMVFSEKKKFSAFFVIALTGILGFCVLNLGMKEPLLPLLTGLFGSSMILISINQKTSIPKQKICDEPIDKRKFMKPAFASLISSPLCGFLPGLGSGQAAVMGSQMIKTDEEQFLFLVGAVNTFVMGISFISLYAISKTRTGSAVAVKDILGAIDSKILLLILIVCLISGIISFYITKYLAKKFIFILSKIEYSLISKITLAILIIVNLIIAGTLGLIILIISTATGIYCISTGVKRTYMLGCLIIPTVILYLF